MILGNINGFNIGTNFACQRNTFRAWGFYDTLYSDSHVPQIMVNQIHQVESLRTMDPVKAIKLPLLVRWRTLVSQKSTSNQVERTLRRRFPRDQQEHGVFRLIHTEISGSWMVILSFDLFVLNPNMMVGRFLVSFAFVFISRTN